MLRHHLQVMLRPFVSRVDTFCVDLAQYRSLIGGLFAMAFFLRDNTFSIDALEVYAPDQLYPNVVDAIANNLRSPIEYVSVFGMDGTFKGRDVLECTHFRLDTGLSVIVYQSSNWTAISPITRSPCTALVNYVSSTSFGCAYPHMTLQRRALLADHAMFQPLPFDFSIMNLLTDRGFDVSWSPIRWPFPRPTRQCYAGRHMCPKQIRYFGDNMWLMDFFDPLSVDRAALQRHYQVPYGTVVAWKLWSSYRCSMGPSCDQIIPERLFLVDGHVVLPALPGSNRLDRRRPHEHPPSTCIT
ncbi:hypothetical protein C8Q80DRAFT_1101445 [Daedaleopsis nitida]|nr:hypothetical protein C8Q80DRAFT_1101445 [Daedaleopsis nitida]